MLKKSLRVIYLMMLLIFSAQAHSCPEDYLPIGPQGNCYPQYTILNSNYLDPNNPDPAWYDCKHMRALDKTIQTNTTFVDGAVIVQVKCCGIGSLNPPMQTAYLTPGQQHTFSIENTECADGNDNNGDSNPRGITNFAFTDFVKKASYSNPNATLFKTISLQNEVNLACALNWNNSQGLSALQIACNNVQFLPSAEQSFFTGLCEYAGYNATYQPNNILPRAQNNHSQTICTDTSTDLICNLPITCTLFCADANCWSPANCSSSSSNPSTIISAQCFFMSIGQSPQPFCCNAPLATDPPTTFPLCPNGFEPTSDCVPPSLASHGNTTPVLSSYFTPAIRVAFDVVPNVFQPVSPWVNQAYNGVTAISLATLQGQLESSQNTIQVCNGTTQSSCLTMPSSSNFTPMTTNLEIIYNTGTSLSPIFTRSPAEGALYGVNLGQYCDLNYDLAKGQPMSTSSCTIEDMNKSPQAFTAKLTSDQSQICVYDANNRQVANCAPVPTMPLPNAGLCSGVPANQPDNFCMQLDFSIPSNISTDRNLVYSAQIINNSTTNSVVNDINIAPTTVYGATLTDPLGVATNLQVYGFITDANYNGTPAGSALALDQNGNFCFDKNGKSTTNCSNKINPGGLWYVGQSDNLLKYMGGGTQICYTSSSANATNQASLCVPIVDIVLPFVDCNMIAGANNVTSGGCPAGANVVNSDECQAYSSLNCASSNDSDGCFIQSQACATPATEISVCTNYKNNCSKSVSAKAQCYSEFTKCTDPCAGDYYSVFLNGFAGVDAIKNALAQYRACKGDSTAYPSTGCKFYQNAACNQKSEQKDAYCGLFSYQCNDYNSYCSYGQTQCYKITGTAVTCGADGSDTCVAYGSQTPLPEANQATSSNLPNCSVANLTNSSYAPC